MKKRLIIIALMFLLLSTEVWAQQGATVHITNPAEGEIVSGLVIVKGTVDFNDFMKYEILLKSGDQLIWVATGYAPVINGNLARMDSRIFLDGAYQMVIRMVRTDSNYTDHLGPNFMIENELGAPQRYPEVASNYLYPPVAGSLFRIKNCSGNNLEIDYHSPQGFCSAGDLWISPKHQHSDHCPYVDTLLIPGCLYRGTAKGEGEAKGVGYNFQAEAGKVYQLDFGGGMTFYVGEVQPDERAESDLGGLEPGDPARQQALSQPPAPSEEAEAETAASAAPQPTATAAPQAAMVAPTAAPPSAENGDPMLPVSGQAAESRSIFVVVAAGFILFLVVGGVVAALKRNYEI